MSDAEHTPPAFVSKPCAICGKPSTAHYRPFCSKRCADVDLHRWLTGAYAIPVTEDEDEDGESTAPPPRLAPE
ncbi:DNA gyrase inhibitor YacG [Azorhizobium sp. AG788]|uniref:DNA gyrase inhibitor YacG n=1 Tax=Azorhizobium sp. AG788 TaxID=2183897 RepID=UPI003139CA90